MAGMRTAPAACRWMVCAISLPISGNVEALPSALVEVSARALSGLKSMWTM